MKRWLLSLLFLLASTAYGQTLVDVTLSCSQGGKGLSVPSIMVPGTNTPTMLIGSYPLATATVYVTGSSPYVEATIYSTSTGTPLSNPTSCDSTGLLQFFVAPGTYDVTFSGNASQTQLSTPFSISAYTTAGANLEPMLGNGTTVVDVSLEAGADWSYKLINAYTVCSVAYVSCTYDARGFYGNQTWSQNISLPSESVLLLGQYTITRGSGIQLTLNNNVTIKGAILPGGESGAGAKIASADTTTDRSPIFVGGSSAGVVQGVDIGYLNFGSTTSCLVSSGYNCKMPISAVAAASGSPATTVYTGTFTQCNTSACVGDMIQVMNVYPAGGQADAGNAGIFLCTASSSTNLTLNNGYGTLDNSPAAAFAVVMGAPAISGFFAGSNFHDFETHSDVGIIMQGVQNHAETLYTKLSNLQLRSVHGSLYLGPNAQSIDSDHLVAWATDENSPGSCANAVGFGVWMNQGGHSKFSGLDIENTFWGINVNGSIEGSNLYFENGTCGGYPATSPTIVSGGGTNFPSAVDWLDISNHGAPTASNIVGSFEGGPRDTNRNSYGSFIVNGLGTPSSGSVSSTCTGTCATTINYGYVAHDYNGNLTEMETVTTTTSGASLSSTIYNSVNRPLIVTGVICYDILKEVSSTWYSLSGGTVGSSLCVPPQALPFRDDGSYSTNAYSVPGSDTTGCITLAGSTICNWSQAGGPPTWDAILAPVDNQVLNMGAYASLWNYTTSSSGLLLQNTTAATSGTSQNSPSIGLIGQAYHGGASVNATCGLQTVVPNGADNGMYLEATCVSTQTGPMGLDAQHYFTNPSCMNAASPAVCTSATAGSVVIAASASSVVVNTSAVNVNSVIQLTFDASLGTALSVTCNATAQQPYVSARTAGTSFTISTGSTFSVNPGCFSFLIVN